ncbi:MAG: hypothetical protein HRT90_09455, partial [Candidatus Margulisbacteria bacterium]|nr:hypothetical protein [Candidatus Margulisiibacteriota bacterium]
WNSGVIGIDTDRIKDRFLRPAMILTKYDHNDYVRASVRSIPNIDMYGILDEIQEKHSIDFKENIFEMEVPTEDGLQIVEAFGGHSQACGFSIHKDKVAPFLNQVRKEMETLPVNDFKYTYEIIDNLTFEDITSKLISRLDKLSPYGQQFEFPMFAMENCTMGNKIKPFGNRFQTNRTPHLEFTVLHKNRQIKAVGFGLHDKYKKLVTKDKSARYNLIFTIEFDSKRRPGKGSQPPLTLNVQDIRKSRR